MADGTHIEWTDATWNVINGCSVTSPGCTNCYAMRLAGTRLRNHPSRAGLTVDSKAGPVWTGETRFNEKVLLDPLKWKRPRRIFVCAHGDLFHESVPDEWIDHVFAVMALAPQHTFQVLTKRPARMLEYMSSIDNGDGKRLEGFRDALIEGAAQSIYHARTGDETVSEWLAVHLPLPNVWLGVSAEDQPRWDERTDILMHVPAAIRWASVEPMIGPIVGLPRLDWVVVGGESGPGSRPMHPDWARSLRDQCAAAGVAFLFKQWGEWVAEEQAPDDIILPGICSRPWQIYQNDGWEPKDEIAVFSVGKKAAGRLLDGVQHDGYPAAAQL